MSVQFDCLSLVVSPDGAVTATMDAFVACPEHGLSLVGEIGCSYCEQDGWEMAQCADAGCCD